MVGSALILLREGLEGALIVAIVLAYLRKLDRRDRFGAIWLGTVAAAAIAIAVGVVVFVTVGELEGGAHELAEAGVMLVAAGVLTWMIFWMRRQARAVKGELQHRVDVALVAGSVLALAAVVFLGVLREGIETVLFFLAAAGQSSTVNSLVGGSLGVISALVLAYAFYRGASWLNLRQFFMVSGAVVLLFAGGLLARALAEFQAQGLIPTLWHPVFDVGSVAALSSKHFFGQVLQSLVGWDPSPSIEELVGWTAYVGVIGTLYFRGVARPTPLRWLRARSSQPTAEVSDA